MPVGAASPIPQTQEQCCEQCVLDGSLCYGYVFTPGHGDNSHSSCSQFDIAFDAEAMHAGNCTTGVFKHRNKAPAKAPKKAPKGAKNVLFIVADDMRPSMGPYAIKDQKSPYFTPALDNLAATGIVFTRAYIQFSYCAPSRNSFMSGRRPDANKVFSFIGTFRNAETGLDWVSLPEQFVLNGYNVGGSGKLFHPQVFYAVCFVSYMPAIDRSLECLQVPANFDQPWSWTIP